MRTGFLVTSANRFGRKEFAPCADKAKVSVIVPVKNEAENLRRCLPALEWADEVFVVDSQSTDQTDEVATAAGATGRAVPLQWVLSQEKELGSRQPSVS